jgi:hypothetical protein
MKTVSITIHSARSYEGDNCNERTLTFDIKEKTLSIREDGSSADRMYPRDFHLMAGLLDLAARYDQSIREDAEKIRKKQS